jgi:hypothetical protein
MLLAWSLDKSSTAHPRTGVVVSPADSDADVSTPETSIPLLSMLDYCIIGQNDQYVKLDCQTEMKEAHLDHKR